MINIPAIAPQEDRKQIVIRKWLIIFGAIFLILGAGALYTYYDIEKKYADRIYPGLFIGDIDLSGLNKEQAKMIIDQKVKKIESEGINFSYQDKQLAITSYMASSTPDLLIDNFHYNIANDIEKAYEYGRYGSFLSKLQSRINLSFHNVSLPASFEINLENIEGILRTNFSSYENLGTNAKLVYTNGIFSIDSEKQGERLAFQKALETFQDQLRNLKQDNIALFKETDIPDILKEDSKGLEIEADKIASSTPFSIFYKDKEWVIDKDTLANLLAIKIEPRFSILKDKTIVGLDIEKTTQFLNDKVASEVNIKAIEPRFKIVDGRVAEFQGSRDGVELNIEETIKKIENELLEGCLSGKTDCGENGKKIEIVITETKSEIKTSDVNNLGIKEIIGTGHSNFKGSPANRRHNIATGAGAVNGTMIKPNEEFSLIKTLGKIDGESGYLPELVIKDNKTTPEFGGGLCQVGTTVFRATVNAGLPVTSRRNHSYRVSYYEPAGTDATIYDPAPDYKFINDTPYNILIQSRIEGNDLYFDFWSTEDGRIATSSYPTIYNIVKPAPTKIIETTDLKPGEKKCTEKAHNGADAYFDYTVTYPNGEVKEQRFSSHYVPWREVCLLGVKELSTASTTPASTGTTDTKTPTQAETPTPPKTTDSQ